MPPKDKKINIKKSYSDLPIKEVTDIIPLNLVKGDLNAEIVNSG